MYLQSLDRLHLWNETTCWHSCWGVWKWSKHVRNANRSEGVIIPPLFDVPAITEWTTSPERGHTLAQVLGRLEGKKGASSAPNPPALGHHQSCSGEKVLSRGVSDEEEGPKVRSWTPGNVQRHSPDGKELSREVFDEEEGQECTTVQSQVPVTLWIDPGPGPFLTNGKSVPVKLREEWGGGRDEIGFGEVCGNHGGEASGVHGPTQQLDWRELPLSVLLCEAWHKRPALVLSGLGLSKQDSCLGHTRGGGISAATGVGSLTSGGCGAWVDLAKGPGVGEGGVVGEDGGGWECGAST
ncbi:uncharacterized protein C8R40DRAFT_1269002 [Lentinula edodes]|uniref:uncharacterized protein n=1 Tax=Lentinula edodes TaxID=5353 RepID=UPI001E8DCA68|nr:uncharacterized protein C8R40DRAFT_1269002 [Lentinula edodes]KAH7868821.1 hypothetical protein C8R40DRAFT_1269002 [Lentinula edodes]